MGEEFGPLAEPVCVDPFDSFSRTLMDLLSTRREQALVHGVLDKRVLEVVFLAAVLLLVLGCLLLAVLMLPLAVQTKPRPARALFFVASVSLAVAMLVAATYELGDFTARYWLLIPQMARLHGTLNAFGFALCGLLGFLWNAPASAGRCS